MGTFSFKVKSTTSLEKKLTDRIKTVVYNRLEKIVPEVELAARNVIERFVTNDPVFRALSGEFAGDESGQDLQAEFGIKDGSEQMNQFLQMLLSTAHVSLNKKIIVQGKNGIGTINVKSLDEREYKTAAISEFKYPSEPSEKKQDKFVKKLMKQGGLTKRQATASFKKRFTYNIRWMNWVLNADRANREMEKDLPDIRYYGIAYDLTDEQRNVSRTGRALMFKKDSKFSKKRGKSGKVGSRIKEFPYRIPPILKTKNGNFVLDIQLSQKYQNAIKDVTKRVALNAIRKLNT